MRFRHFSKTLDFAKLPTQKKQTTTRPCCNTTSNYASVNDEDYYYDDNNEKDHFYDWFPSVLSLVYSLIATVKAADYQMVAFILYLYFGTISWVWLSRVLNGLPPNKESRKKEFLKIARWALKTSLNLELAIIFAPWLHPIAGVFIWIMALVGSVFEFYLSFINQNDPYNDNQIESSETCSVCTLKVKSLEASSHLEIV